MLKKLYFAFDNALLYGANKINQTWNWTTGKTKSELAIATHTGGAVLLNTVFAIKSPWILPISIPVFGLGILGHNKEFKEVEKREIDAMDKEAKDMYVENRKREYKISGNLWEMLALAVLPSDSWHSLSNAAIGGSFYLMRADYLPPKKNCVKRGLEKLTESFKKAITPAPQPVPITNGLISPDYLFQ